MDSHALVNLQPTNIGPQVILPYNIKMNPQLVGQLPITLPPAAIETHVFAVLQHSSLLLVGQLCDDGYQAINKKLLQVLDSNKILILTGKHNTSDDIWDIL